MARTMASAILRKMEDGTLWVENETPTGDLNSSNKTFVLADTPDPATSLRLFVNGQVLSLTEDYSLSGDTITTVSAFPSGTIFRASYKVLPA